MVSAHHPDGGGVITLFDGARPPMGASLGRVSRGRRRVKPRRGSFASRALTCQHRWSVMIPAYSPGRVMTPCPSLAIVFSRRPGKGHLADKRQ